MQDFTVFGGSLSTAHARKICKVSVRLYYRPFFWWILTYLSICWLTNRTMRWLPYICQSWAAV